MDALLESSKQTPTCKICHKTAELHLKFGFGLEATSAEWRVLDVFVPSEPVQWNQREGKKVTFYPFLVVLGATENGGRARAFWLPYWHIVEGGGTREVVRGAGAEDIIERKYGQWAPFMDGFSFQDLVAKARQKGYLN